MNNWEIAIGDRIERLEARVVELEGRTNETPKAVCAVCTVRTVGGSVVLSLPKDLLGVAGFQVGDKLKLKATDGKIELQLFTHRPAKP